MIKMKLISAKRKDHITPHMMNPFCLFSACGERNNDFSFQFPLFLRKIPQPSIDLFQQKVAFLYLKPVLVPEKELFAPEDVFLPFLQILPAALFNFLQYLSSVHGKTSAISF